MNTPLRLLSLLLCVMTLLCVLAPAAVFAADNAPISELALSQGDEGMMTLEKNGYTVMGRPLTGDYWLGYKRGGSAVTGLVVSSDNSNSVTVNGIAYQRVGSLGGAGSLYLTRDAGAGTAVLSIHLQSSAEYADQPFYALRNDGTVPMLRDSGEPCNLGSDDTAYLYLLRDGVFRPYIQSVTVAAGDSLRSAISAAAAAGCDWYYDPGLTAEDGSIVVIGCVRTADEDAAITCIAAGEEAPEVEEVGFEPAGEIRIAGEPPYRLFQTRDRSMGNPIIGLTGSAVPVRSSDVMNKWAEKIFVKFNTSAASVNQVKSESLYQQFLKNGGDLTNVPVLIPAAEESSVTPLAYVCAAEGQPEDLFPAAESPEPTTEPETDEEGQEPTETPDLLESDEYLDQEAEVIAEPVDAEAEDELASVFADGNVIVLIALAVLGAAGISAAAICRNKKRRAEEGQDDEG